MALFIISTILLAPFAFFLFVIIRETFRKDWTPSPPPRRRRRPVKRYTGLPWLGGKEIKD